MSRDHYSPRFYDPMVFNRLHALLVGLPLAPVSPMISSPGQPWPCSPSSPFYGGSGFFGVQSVESETQWSSENNSGPPSLARGKPRPASATGPGRHRVRSSWLEPKNLGWTTGYFEGSHHVVSSCAPPNGMVPSSAAVRQVQPPCDRDQQHEGAPADYTVVDTAEQEAQVGISRGLLSSSLPPRPSSAAVWQVQHPAGCTVAAAVGQKSQVGIKGLLSSRNDRRKAFFPDLPSEETLGSPSR